MIADAAVEALRFVAEILDVDGELEPRPQLVGGAKVHHPVVETIEVPADAGGGVARDVVAGVVVERAGAELPVAPREAEITHAGDEAGDLLGLARHRAAEIAVRLDHRVVRGEGQTLEQAGQKRELLLVVEFPALDVGGAGIGGGETREAGVFAVEAVVVAAGDRAGGEAAHDVVADALAEKSDGRVADRFEIILERGIPGVGDLREERGVVDREGLVGLGDRLVGERVVERGTAEARGPAEASLEVRRDLVREVRAGKRLGVAARDAAERAGVVARGGADRIGGLLRDGAAVAGTHPAPA